MARTIQPEHFSAKEVTQLPANLLSTNTVSLGPIKSWTGYARMRVDNGGGKTSQNSLFYWLFESRNSALANAPADIPVLIWLNGGPGASSLAGLFLENGPFLIGSDAAATIATNAASWNREMHLLYVDQPVGAGFSVTSDPSGYVTSEQELREQFCTALEQLFSSEQFSRFRSSPLYIAGESYAGKYIPNIAVELLTRSERYPNTPKLSGVVIGDGWMIPGKQTRVQLDFGLATGFLDRKQHATLSKQCDALDALIAAGQFVEANTLGNKITGALESCGGNPDFYDVRDFAQLGTTALQLYLDSKAVQEAIGVDCPWQIADDGGPVADALVADIYAPATEVIRTMLQAARGSGFRVLFYTGDFDMACGFMGTENMLWDFDFPRLGDASHVVETKEGARTWRDLDRQVWVSAPDTTLGYIKSLGGLTQVTVADAGHLVPMDRPEVSRLMVETWVFNRPFPVVQPDLG